MPIACVAVTSGRSIERNSNRTWGLGAAPVVKIGPPDASAAARVKAIVVVFFMSGLLEFDHSRQVLGNLRDASVGRWADQFSEDKLFISAQPAAGKRVRALGLRF